jgi:hypothetical protein
MNMRKMIRRMMTSGGVILRAIVLAASFFSAFASKAPAAKKEKENGKPGLRAGDRVQKSLRPDRQS